MLTKAQLEQYHKDGYVIVEELFDEGETALMLEISIAAAAKTLTSWITRRNRPRGWSRLVTMPAANPHFGSTMN